MKSYKITHKNKTYIVKAKDSIDAVKRVKKMKDADSGRNYQKYWSGDGTVYSQTYNISRGEYNRVLNTLEKEKPTAFAGDSVYGSYDALKERLSVDGSGVVYPGTTAAKYIAKVLSLNNFRTDRNVRFVIKDCAVKDERLSPMTYRKLKEFGYTSNQWKNLSQEQANKIVASHEQKKANTSKKESTQTKQQKSVETKNEQRPRLNEHHRNNSLWKFSVEKKEEMAESSRTKPETLKLLSEDKSPYVRLAVAENKKTPIELLEKLSKDYDADIRCAVAENENTPAYILEKLSKDTNGHTRLAVAENKNTSSQSLDRLARYTDYDISSGDNVPAYVALNENTHPKTLEYLSKHKNDWVRRNVATNKNTSTETLKELLKDEEAYIREIAQKRLEKQKETRSR